MGKPEWQSTKTVWVAAGGTAGHLLPAVGVAEALVRAGIPRESIGFIGSMRHLESEILEPYRYQLMRLDVQGITRSASVSNLGTLMKLARAVARLLGIAKRNRPRVVIGFGGYFSFPPMLAGKLAGVPCVVVETNSVAGLANRLSARLAVKSFASTEGSGIAGAEVIGVPLRPEIYELGRNGADQGSFRSEHDIAEDALLICAFGGSLGSWSINSTVADLVETWDIEFDRPIAVYHVIGSRDFGKMAGRAADLGSSSSKVTYIFSEFDPEIYRAVASSDLVVSRAGSGTVAELGYFGTPSILAPLPNAPGDHQTRNARKLEASGAARVIPDSELTRDRLAEEIGELVTTPGLLDAMSAHAREQAPSDGAPTVAKFVVDLIERGEP